MAMNIRQRVKLYSGMDRAETELTSYQGMVADRATMNTAGYDKSLGDSTRAAADQRINESKARLLAFATYCESLGDADATIAANYIRQQVGA